MILPTHHCFDDALDFLTALAKQGLSMKAFNDYRLVHGICEAPDGEQYAHAWVECMGIQCIFSGMVGGQMSYFTAALPDFYEEFRVRETTKYTVLEAHEANRRSNHFGPWVEKYRALCGNDHRILGATRPVEFV